MGSLWYKDNATTTATATSTTTAATATATTTTTGSLWYNDNDNATATTNHRSMYGIDSDDEYHSARDPLSPIQHGHLPSPPTPNHHNPQQMLVVAYSQSTREEAVAGVSNVNAGSGEEGSGGGDSRRTAASAAAARRLKRDVMVDRAGLGFRVLEMVVSLIAFSVMASDKTQGWSGDSFDRYREYRYVVAVNAIAFAYAAFQAVDMTYQLVYVKHIISYSLRPHFDFLIDQILAYLLISASSSAATRVDDWVSNWGKDDFTEMATASIGMSFLAFFAFAVSSLISGYKLCKQKSL